MGNQNAQMDDVFMCKSTWVFRKTFEILLLLEVFFMAIYLCHFTSGPSSRPYLHIPTIASYIVSVVFIAPMIARNHVLVHATIHIKGAMVGAVLEDAEEVASMRHDLQVNLEKRLVDMGSSILDLQSVFEDMDADNSGSLSYRELRLAFAALGVFYSPSKFRILLRIMDPDQSQCVSWVEFHAFITCQDALSGAFAGRSPTTKTSTFGSEENDEKGGGELTGQMPRTPPLNASSPLITGQHGMNMDGQLSQGIAKAVAKKAAERDRKEEDNNLLAAKAKE